MELKRFNKMVRVKKDARKSKISEPVGSADLDGIESLREGDITQSEFARNSSFSFASGALSNNLQSKAKSIKNK